MEQPTEPPPPSIELVEDAPEDTVDNALLMITWKLGGLAALLEQVQEAEEEVRGQVQHARELGATWAQVGQVAGIKPQSAYQRWTDTGRQKHREYEKKRRDSYTPPPTS